jgi:hypothetical protein
MKIISVLLSLFLLLISQNQVFATIPKRIVAIGDLHGDLIATHTALKKAGVMNDSEEWIGGKTVLVQVGDLIDRGPDDKKILDLFESLKPLAKKAGGEVITLLGNHEAMNVSLDFRYAWFTASRDFDKYYSIHETDTKINNKPEFLRGRASAFSPGGPYALILSTFKSVVVLGDTVFVHGGLLPVWANHGVDLINAEASYWMKGLITKPFSVSDMREGPLWARNYSKNTTQADCGLLI